MNERTPLPWYSIANSWQYTTIYDANEHPICRFDLEDWGVTEDSQDALEKVQAQAAAFIVKAANSHEALVKALERIRDFPYIGAKAESQMALIAGEALSLVGTPTEKTNGNI